MASNLQKIRTDKYGELEVVQSFHEGRLPIHLLKNGAYVFSSGLPVSKASDLRDGLGGKSTFLPEALDWLEHKDDRVFGLIREIKHLHGKLVYADDNSPVNSVEDIIAFYEPGPFREAAFAVYAQMVAGKQEAQITPQAPAKQPAATTRKAAGKTTAKAGGKKAESKKSDPPGQQAAAATG